ncbi:sesquipedalian-1-like [Arapaima gigas]
MTHDDKFKKYIISRWPGNLGEDLIRRVVMKIHGKVLSHYLSCCSPVDKAGYLYRKSERTGSYQKRWFILKGNLLFYQERPGDSSPLGVFVLEGCSVELCDSDEQFAFSVSFSGQGGGTYKLAAENQAAQESWIKALLSASHGFLAMLVRDLERQYKEVISETRGSVPSQQSPLDDKGLTQFLASQNYGPSLCMHGRGPAGRECQSCNAGQLLHVSLISRKSAAKRSPKLWTNKVIHERPVNESVPQIEEWSSGGELPLEDFCTLHELYGKDVKDLLAARQVNSEKDKDVEEEEAADSE